LTTAQYFLTPGAVDDIRELGEWSLKRWGKDKTVQYLTELHQGLEYIAANFKIFENNKSRDDLSGGSGLLLNPINKHYVVFAPIGGEAIAVAAVIRQGRDIPSILQKDGFAIRRDLQEIQERIAQGLIAPPGKSKSKDKKK
jgi:plasmid stabilization system protein ParE